MEFRAARDFLLSHRGDYETAYAGFQWPHPFIAVGGGYVASEEVARSIFEHSQANLAAYKRIRRLEFAELPKTISGKIRRVDLRVKELTLREQTERARAENQYWE